MRIAYVAKHDSGGADDEGAVTHALTELGHDVQRLREEKGQFADRLGADFVLFHKWSDFEAMSRLKTPKVFWYFDLVDYRDPTLASRCLARMNWMKEATPLVELGFCTDGDWCDLDRSGKLVQLCQGADGRIVRASPNPNNRKILFTGTSNGGTTRRSFVTEMERRWGGDFHHVQAGVYRESLRNLIAQSAVVVAPDGPVTAKYWSNRVYNALGFGAFLIHPYCDRLTLQYLPHELATYTDREDLHLKIEHYRNNIQQRCDVARAGYLRTVQEHLYTHRCKTLIETVQRRLGL